MTITRELHDSKAINYEINYSISSCSNPAIVQNGIHVANFRKPEPRNLNHIIEEKNHKN